MCVCMCVRVFVYAFGYFWEPSYDLLFPMPQNNTKAFSVFGPFGSISVSLILFVPYFRYFWWLVTFLPHTVFHLDNWIFGNMSLLFFFLLSLSLSCLRFCFMLFSASWKLEYGINVRTVRFEYVCFFFLSFFLRSSISNTGW